MACELSQDLIRVPQLVLVASKQPLPLGGFIRPAFDTRGGCKLDIRVAK